MAFAGIFQPFERLRWIRFGLLMRAVNSGAAFSVPQTTALASLAFANQILNSYFRLLTFKAVLLEIKRAPA